MAEAARTDIPEHLLADPIAQVAPGGYSKAFLEAVDWGLRVLEGERPRTWTSGPRRCPAHPRPGRSRAGHRMASRCGQGENPSGDRLVPDAASAPGCGLARWPRSRSLPSRRARGCT